MADRVSHRAFASALPLPVIFFSATARGKQPSFYTRLASKLGIFQLRRPCLPHVDDDDGGDYGIVDLSRAPLVVLGVFWKHELGEDGGNVWSELFRLSKISPL